MSKNRSKNTRRRAQPLVSVGCCLLLGVVLAACPSPGDTTPTSDHDDQPDQPAGTTTTQPVGHHDHAVPAGHVDPGTRDIGAAGPVDHSAVDDSAVVD